MLKREEEDNLSSPSSYVANAHNEIYAFYTEKTAFWRKIWANGGGGVPTAPPLNAPLQTLIASSDLFTFCILKYRMLSRESPFSNAVSAYAFS